MRRIIAILFAVCSFGRVAVAEQVTVGNVTLTLPPPQGYCDLDPRQASDARLLNLVGTALGANRLLAMSAECTQLSDWRTGRRRLLANYMQFQTLRAWEYSMPAPPAEVVKATCNQLRAQGERLSQQVGPEVQRRLESAMSTIRFGEQKFMGVVHEDATGCYAALLQRIRAETGEDIEQATISGITTVKGKLIYVYGFAPFAGGTVVQGLLEQVKTSVGALQGANDRPL
jgi:hypothetical protein